MIECRFLTLPFKKVPPIFFSHSMLKKHDGTSKQLSCVTTSIDTQLDYNEATTASCVSCHQCDTPMTQKGFRANFSLPPHPLYLQQQPADHILTMYSTPNTTMVTISCGRRGAKSVGRELRGSARLSRVIHSPGCTRHSRSCS